MVRLFAESARSAAPAAALLTLGVGAAAQLWAPLDLDARLGRGLAGHDRRPLLPRRANISACPTPRTRRGLYRGLFVATQLLRRRAPGPAACCCCCTRRDPDAHGFALVLLVLIVAA